MLTTIQARVQFLAETNPTKEVFVFVSTTGLRSTLSCQQVYELSSKMGSLLKKEGINPGDVVCNTLPNSPEMVICDFAILAAGGTILNKTAYLSDGTDLRHLLNASKCKLVIADPTQSPNVWEMLKKRIDEISKHGHVRSKLLPFLERVILAPIARCNKEFINRIQKEEETFFYKDGSLSDTGTIWMTSGTSGLPKLIIRSHQSLLATGRIWATITKEHSNTILFNNVAMGHGSSFAYSFLESCATRVLIDHRFQLPADMAAFVWKVICTEKCTAALISPSIFKGIIREADFEKNNYMLDVLCTVGQPVQKHWSSVLNKITRSVCLIYGSTEVSYCCYKFCTTSSDVLDYIVGYPAAKDVEVKVVDDLQQETTPNTPGELLVRCDLMFEGYVGIEEKNKEVFTPDGWFKTNDLAFKDKDGCLYVKCRRSDAITRGPATLYPAYFERIIRSCSLVADVIVIPLPDKDLSQEICACVILNKGITADENEVARMCDSFFVKGSDVPPPRYYMLMKHYPLLSIGKPDKKKLINMAKEKFNLNE